MSFFTRSALFCGALLTLSQAATAQATLLDNFESTRLLHYETYTTGFMTENAANPAVSPANSSTTVGSFQRYAVQYSVLVITPRTTVATKWEDVAPYLGATPTKTISMKFYSPTVGRHVDLSLENVAKVNAAGAVYPAGRLAAFHAVTTVANAWETLTFTFDTGFQNDPTVLTTDIDQIVLLIDANLPAGGPYNADTYSMDDIMGPGFAAPPPAMPAQLYDNFEGTRAVSYAGYGALTSSGFTPDTVNFLMSAQNSSAQIARFTRSTTQYDVLFIRPLAQVMDAGSYLLGGTRNMTMKVYSPGPGHIFQITMQDSTRGRGPYPGGRHSEHRATTTATNAWETLTFVNGAAGANARPDPTVSNANVNEFVILIDPNTFAAQRYFVDDWYGPAQQGFVGVPADKEVATGVTVFPNPSNGVANIRFSLPASGTVSVRVYDLQGRLVATPLAPQTKGAGDQAVRFSTADLAGGLYQYRVVTDRGAVSGKLSVVR